MKGIKTGHLSHTYHLKKAYNRVDQAKLWCCLKKMGIRGRVIAFLKAVLYSNVSCEVKVGEECSEPFVVSCGLRQGFILSPLLFSLYVNSLVYKLKEAEVGVKCRSQVIPVLLYADDAVILAEDERSMRQGLDTFAEWCSEWAVEINVKCGVMHVRRKGMKRMEVKFYVGGNEVKVVEVYKYLGCVVSEHLQSVRMAEERAKAGARALGDWLRRCRAAAGEVKGSIFMKLMEMLVESVLLYGAEVWGCGGQLRPVENVQMRAARIFLGVGRLHPLVFQQFEMNMLPVKWEAMKRSMEFGCR